MKSRWRLPFRFLAAKRTLPRCYLDYRLAAAAPWG